MNCSRFNNVAKWHNIARWHLMAQTLSANGHLARPVVFDKSGWEKYRILAQAALKAVKQENEK